MRVGVVFANLTLYFVEEKCASFSTDAPSLLCWRSDYYSMPSRILLIVDLWGYTTAAVVDT